MEHFNPRIVVLGSERARRIRTKGTKVEILDFRLPSGAALEDDEVQGVGDRRGKGMKGI